MQTKLTEMRVGLGLGEMLMMMWCELRMMVM